MKESALTLISRFGNEFRVVGRNAIISHRCRISGCGWMKSRPAHVVLDLVGIEWLLTRSTIRHSPVLDVGVLLLLSDWVVMGRMTDFVAVLSRLHSAVCRAARYHQVDVDAGLFQLLLLRHLVAAAKVVAWRRVSLVDVEV